MDSMPVSKRKGRAGRSGELSLWKWRQVEVESESELGEDREKLDEVEKALVGIQEALEERNALHREQNHYLKRIMQALEGGDIISKELVDSTLKE